MKAAGGGENMTEQFDRDLEDSGVIFLKPRSLWLTAGRLFAFIKALIIPGWEKRRSVSADICRRENGRIVSSVCSRSFKTPSLLWANIELKQVAFTLLSASVFILLWEIKLKEYDRLGLGNISSLRI